MARRRRTWRELDPVQRTRIVVGGVVQVALQVAALLDLRRRSQAELNGSKRVWVMASFVNFVGPIAYFLTGRRRRGAGTAVGS
jgi:hypothetical protein